MAYDPHRGQHFDTQHPGASDQSLVWTTEMGVEYYIEI